MSYSKVAQGLAGLRPWVMARAPMWADDWREGLDPRDLPCRRAASVKDPGVKVVPAHATDPSPQFWAINYPIGTVVPPSARASFAFFFLKPRKP